MAGKKKNKKSAANPARGFATTSIASKAKDAPSTEEDRKSLVKNKEGANETSNSSNAEVPPSPEPSNRNPLADLSPDQLEAELEDSELQLIVDQHAQKSKREATRHSSRLHTERRLLRTSAERLFTTSWINDEILKKILKQIDFEYLHDQDKLVETTSRLGSIPVNDLTVKVWTLQRTLKGLGFSDSCVDDAITSIVSGKVLLGGEFQITAKESLWGLDECLEHIAVKAGRDELPGYDNHQTERLKKEKAQSQADQQDLKDTDHNKSFSKGLPTPQEIPTTNHKFDGSLNRHQVIVNEPGQQSDSSEEKSTDDEAEPHQLVEKYIRLQTKLFTREPDLTIIPPQNGKKSKARPPTTATSADQKSMNIWQKIQALERDILFDKETALQKWSETRLGLLAEAAERRRHLSDTLNVSKDRDPQQDLNTSPNANDEDEDDVGLNDFFSSLPEQVTGDESGTQTIVRSEGVLTTVRDFGKWSGSSPRKLLEDACKARDTSCSITYRLISSTSFSNRHMLHVDWSKPQDVSLDFQFEGTSYTMDDKHVSVEMSNVSCPNQAQSEAYISTVSMFLIFSSSPKEEKLHFRLPSVWRDLWSELAENRREQLGQLDKEELRNIKQLVEEKRDDTEYHSNVVDESTRKIRSQVGDTSGDLITSTKIQNDTTEDLVEAWKSRESLSSFQQMLKSRSKLPIWTFRRNILEAIQNNQAIVLCGETGCGKSTQVPSFLLENELSNGRPCKIYCTEPRRISAISLARRVSEELGERKNEVGGPKSLVGYAIRLESRISQSTRLVYATTGIVMRMLERTNDLEDVSHLVLDEVHERTIDSDFLLIVLRKLMARRPSLRVVLMSATVNAEQFSKYLGGAPVLNIPGRTFPVETKYLEDAIELTNYDARGDSRADTLSHELEDSDEILDESQRSTALNNLAGYSMQTRKILAHFNEYRLDYGLILRLLETVATDSRFVEFSKAVLLFMPGMAEIRRLNDLLLNHKIFASGWEIFPLHSTIPTEDQEKAFLVPRSGVRKIVIATNIAETGITIPDVTCVIDTGKHKEMRFDERRQLSRLIESFISRANAKQRRGRAGRVQHGLCFHLFTRLRHDNLMPESQTPEILRLSLQDLALRVKLCKLGNIEQTLSEALDPPLAKNIRRAIDSLIAVEALTAGEGLTALGRQLAKLPLDVYLGKLILNSRIFRCLDVGITIAAILSSKSPFQASIGARSQADTVRLAFKRGDSDILTTYNAYSAWKKACLSSGASEFQFCRKNFLNPQTLSSIEDLKAQLTTALVDAGWVSLDETARESLSRAYSRSKKRHFVEIPSSISSNSTNDLIVNSVIAWSFYPKLLIREGKGYRSVANNQHISLYPASVNKGVSPKPKFLSFYQIMQSANKHYNAHETSAVEDLAVSMLCGDADFKIYSGVVAIDGNRIRFSVSDWKMLLALKQLRIRMKEIIAQSYQSPETDLTASQTWWLNVWQEIFDNYRPQE